ncbi:DUF5677 domain-containing protein [Bacillus haynesii]|uniref:DUF5677 domain-containing protein n=1 Tax=Bacillus haynesii TaxID=1925021 RepID=UPI00228127E4|nr:DUF5677 domain-containing protein [Bacillus haynesii]MCY8371952.1 DUF5677 domain-containing protein [Bacillus haynesii]MEC1478320.1 DUF5677 domain-containing protein [Bacillus haynesii]
MKKSLINRKMDKGIQKEFNAIGRLMDSFVDYGDIMYKRLYDECGSNELNAPLFTLLAHILNMVDGVAIMSKKGASEGMIPLCRSMFEAALYFEYMYTEPKDRGVIAYQVHSCYQEIKLREMFDSNTNSGKKHRGIFTNEFSGFEEVQDIPVSESCKHLFNFLKRKEIQNVKDAWDKKKPKNWYSLYTDLRNLRDLARYLNVEARYVFLYKRASEFIHAGATMKNIKVGNGVGGVSLRNYEEVPFYSSMTFSIITEIFMLIGKKEFALWYINNAKKQVERTSRLNIMVEYEIAKL